MLYELTPRDRHITWLDPIVFEAEASGAAAFLEAFFQVPPDRVLLLYNVCGLANSGAAQNATNLDLNMATPIPGGGFDRFVIKRRQAPTDFVATPLASIQWDGSMVIPSSKLISLSVNYSAGAAVNFAVLTVFGMLIPNGNFQRL